MISLSPPTPPKKKKKSSFFTYAYLVFKKPLSRFSQSPMTGFFRDGYCRVGPEDGGNHAVAGTLAISLAIKCLFALFPFFFIQKGAPFLRFGSNAHIFLLDAPTTIGVLTREFLDFSASRGNNLRSIGLEPGCKWCLCTARWKEAVDARKGDDDPVVPK